MVIKISNINKIITGKQKVYIYIYIYTYTYTLFFEKRAVVLAGNKATPLFMLVTNGVDNRINA